MGAILRHAGVKLCEATHGKTTKGPAILACRAIFLRAAFVTIAPSCRRAVLPRRVRPSVGPSVRPSLRPALRPAAQLQRQDIPPPPPRLPHLIGQHANQWPAKPAFGRPIRHPHRPGRKIRRGPAAIHDPPPFAALAHDGKNPDPARPPGIGMLDHIVQRLGQNQQRRAARFLRQARQIRPLFQCQQQPANRRGRGPDQMPFRPRHEAPGPDRGEW